jgi:2-dehydropantoate 2-reductase
MITILGTGAMATLFAARLGPVTPVTLLGTWADAIDKINRDGINVEGGQPVKVAATTNPADCQGSQFALVLVKAWQTPRVASQIETFLPPDGIALTLQNGLANFETLAAKLGKARTALGTTTLGATLLGPGHVKEGGRGPIHVAEHHQLAPLVELLRSASFDVIQSPINNLQSLVWGKLVVNCAINPLTALLRIPNGELLVRPDALAVMEAAAHEVAAVAGVKGIQLPFDDAAAQAQTVARATAENQSSMLQDVLHNRPTEVDAINGALVKAAIEVGVPVPVNETLWRLVRGMDGGTYHE